jgi:hypothetical protein
MIDIDNYRRAIEWLRRGVKELSQDPENRFIKLGVLHSFEVTYNISEGILRQAYVLLADDDDAPYVSARELILRAHDEGLALSSPKRWMHDGFVIETMRESCLQSPQESFDLPLELVLSFALELEAFAQTLEVRGAAIA